MILQTDDVSFLFSVIMPSYQQRPYLPAALDSLDNQGQVSLELLIQDGGSTDGSVEFLQKIIPNKNYAVSLESREDNGQAAAVNTGLRKARGDFFCFLNSDDLLYPNALSKVAAYFEQHPDVDLVYGRADFLDSNGRVLRPYPVEPWNPERLREKCIICQPACFWRADLMKKAGYFDETLFGAFDYDYWLRAASRGKFAFLDEILAGSRCHIEAKTFKYRERMILESCLIQARHNKGITSLANIRELAIVKSISGLNPCLPHLLSRGLFYLRYAFYMFALGSKTSEFLRPAFWQCFFPSYSTALKLEQNPMSRVTP